MTYTNYNKIMNDRVSNDCVFGNIVLLYIAIGIAILGIIFMVCCNQLCFSISCMLWGLLYSVTT